MQNKGALHLYFSDCNGPQRAVDIKFNMMDCRIGLLFLTLCCEGEGLWVIVLSFY